MKIDDLIENFPNFYHMAEDGSWGGIQTHGLLSTSRLLDLYQYIGSSREAIESRHRPNSLAISHVNHGNAIVRDQKPMSDNGLEKCLADGLTPRQWYEILNSKTFFWTSEIRLGRLLNAGPYRNRPHDVLIVESSQLILDYKKSIFLCPMNSGCTRPFPHPRGLKTFRNIEDYPFEERKKKARATWDAVVEVAIEGGVPNIIDYTIRVESRQGDQLLDVIWTR